MKTILLTLISLLFIGSYSKLKADEPDNEKMELLRQLSRTAPNDTLRLKILSRLRRSSVNSQVEAYYADKLLKEAEKMKNSKYICDAYLAFMALEYNNYNPEGVNRWMKLLGPLAKKEKLYDSYFFGQRCVVDMYIVREEYERGIKEANLMLDEARKLNNSEGIILAYQCLSNVYRMTYRSAEATDFLQKAYEIPCSEQWLKIEILNSLIAVHQDLDDLPNWLKWTKAFDNYLNEQCRKDSKATLRLRGWLMMTYVSYLSYYTKTGDFKQAEKYLHLAEQHSMDGYGTFSFNYYLARYLYYYDLEHWEEALGEVDKLISIFQNSSSYAYSTYFFRKASLLHKMNKDDEALGIYKQAIAIRDSVNIVILNKQSEQLKKDYNANQLLLEKEKINRNTQWIFLISLTVIFLFLLWFIVRMYRIRSQLKKSESTMRRMADKMEQANVAKELFLSTISSAISVPMNEVVDGSMALVSDKVTDVEERKLLSESINKTSTKLMGLINNILDLSRLEAGMMKYNEENINLAMFIRNLLDTMPEDIKQRLVVSSPEDKSLVVRMDVVRLQEVFNNLLLTSTGECSLTVTQEGDSVYVRVTGSILSSGEQLQEIVVANEVNRLLMEHFNGRYEIISDVVPAQVRLIIPLVEECSV